MLDSLQNCYNRFYSEFTFILKHIFCLPKKPQYLFFHMACLQVSPVLINCTMWSSYLHPTVSHVFQGPGLSQCRFFRVQVFLGPAPGSWSKFQKQPEIWSVTRLQITLTNIKPFLKTKRSLELGSLYHFIHDF